MEEFLIRQDILLFRALKHYFDEYYELMINYYIGEFDVSLAAKIAARQHRLLDIGPDESEDRLDAFINSYTNIERLNVLILNHNSILKDLKEFMYNRRLLNEYKR